MTRAQKQGTTQGWYAGNAARALPSFGIALLLLGVLLALVAWAPAAEADAPGRLVALVRDQATQTEHLAHVDAATGALTPFGAGLVNCCTPVSLDAALDPVGRRYHAVMTLDGETAPRVVSFEADTGAATAGATLATTASVNFLAYDSSTARLLALFFDGSADRQRLAVVTPESGEVAWLGDGVEACCSVTTTLDAAFDSAGRRLYAMMRPFTGTEAIFYSFDVDTGQLVGALPLSATAGINFLAFDPAGNTLWAVANDPQSDAERLATVDPLSGTVAFVGEGAAGCCALFPTDAALEPGAGHLVAPMLDGDAVARLYSFALATGAVVHEPPVPAGYALHFLTYVPAQAQTLYLPAVQRGQE